jgi:hypothetical protein
VLHYVTSHKQKLNSLENQMSFDKKDQTLKIGKIYRAFGFYPVFEILID